MGKNSAAAEVNHAKVHGRNPCKRKKMTMVALTISIVTANNKSLILDCLRSIYATAGDLEIEIFVVLNASSDDSQEAIQQSFPDVNCIINHEKLGFTVNHNMVMRRARGEHILVLNDDTIILEGALKKMVEFMNTSPEVGILGCRIYNSDGSLQWSCGKSFHIKMEIFKSALLRSFVPMIENIHYHATQEVFWVSGACLLARKKALEEVGFFDENIVIYFEDGDLCIRANQAGWKVVFYPHAQIIHHRGQTRKQFLARDMFIIYQSRLYFFSKHCGFLTMQLVRMVTILEVSFRYLRTLMTPHGPGIPKKDLLKTYGRVVQLALYPVKRGEGL